MALMDYFKSTLVGFVTLFLSLVVLVILEMRSALRAAKARGMTGGEV